MRTLVLFEMGFAALLATGAMLLAALSGAPEALVATSLAAGLGAALLLTPAAITYVRRCGPDVKGRPICLAVRPATAAPHVVLGEMTHDHSAGNRRC